MTHMTKCIEGNAHRKIYNKMHRTIWMPRKMNGLRSIEKDSKNVMQRTMCIARIELELIAENKMHMKQRIK